MEYAWLGLVVLSGAVIQGCMMLICNMPSLRTRGETVSYIASRYAVTDIRIRGTDLTDILRKIYK